MSVCSSVCSAAPSAAASMAAGRPRSGIAIQPKPIAHLNPCAQSQWAMASTRPPMPSHLWSRYILSSPPSHRSGHRGRVARIMARLMQPMARMPVN